MKKITLITCLLFSILTVFQRTQAQSKVFKEVGEDISSQVKPIWQDGAMVGYVVFTQLEKASADSFNYKITIMDENLNDIGTVKFRELKLGLYDVAFEQDVLCLAYWKSNFVGVEFKNYKEYKAALPNAKTWIYTQFLSLNGKIIGANAIKADVKPITPITAYGMKPTGNGKLKFGVLLKNLPQKGFAVAYGDDSKNNLVVYNTASKQIWQKTIAEEADDYYMLTSQQDVWLLAKKKDKMREGGYELLGYNTNDSSTFPKYMLKDKKGNSLRVIAFENDPATGKPYIAGSIIDPDHGNQLDNANQRTRGAYDGVYSIDFPGHKKGDVHEKYSYWNDGSKPGISKRGRWESNSSYCRFEQVFRDYNGNTFFCGSGLQHKPKWVSIGFTIVTIPLFVPPLFILALSGSQKARLTQGMIVKLDGKGALSQEDAVTLKNTSWFRGVFPVNLWDSRNYYHLANSETKTNYLIVDDARNITIYNVNQKKILRTIAHKDGNIHTSILPAKEGYVMVSEYNQKEKYTRVSIEAL